MSKAQESLYPREQSDPLLICQPCQSEIIPEPPENICHSNSNLCLLLCRLCPISIMFLKVIGWDHSYLVWHNREVPTVEYTECFPLITRS